VTRDRRAIPREGTGLGLIRELSREGGFTEHLVKPVDMDLLLDTFERLASGAPPD
jgi:hypothetical protein